MVQLENIYQKPHIAERKNRMFPWKYFLSKSIPRKWGGRRSQCHPFPSYFHWSPLSLHPVISPSPPRYMLRLPLPYFYHPPSLLVLLFTLSHLLLKASPHLLPHSLQPPLHISNIHLRHPFHSPTPHILIFADLFLISSFPAFPLTISILSNLYSFTLFTINSPHQSLQPSPALPILWPYSLL